MSNSNVLNLDSEADSLLGLVETIVGRGSYDTTIRATIVEAVDRSAGKYRVSYQNNTFYAYSEGESNYRKGTEVFILVPKNDFSEEKRIIGSVKKFTEEYVQLSSYRDIYKFLSSNGLQQKDLTKTEIGKKSGNSDSIVLYDIKNEEESLFTIDKYFLEDLKDARTDTLWFQATFRTALSQNQYSLNTSNANYGLRLTFSRQDDKGQPSQQRVSLNVNHLVGEPFKQDGKTPAYLFISNVKWSEVSSIDKIEFFSENFLETGLETDDLFVKDLRLYAAQTVGEKTLASTVLSIEALTGTRIDNEKSELPEGEQRNETIALKSTLLIGGLTQENNVSYYWFKENSKVTTNSNDVAKNKIVYSSIGGAGWEILNQGDFDEKDPTIIHWKDTEKNEWSFTKEDLTSYESKIKCVARYKEESYEDSVLLYNYNIEEYFNLKSDKKTFNGLTDIVTIWIEPTKIFKESFPNATVKAKMLRKGKYEENPSDIQIDTLEYTERGENVLDSATYYAEVTASKKVIDEETGVEKEESIVDKYVTNSLTLSVKDASVGETFLEIDNGDQIFKYTPEGYSPASEAIQNAFPQTILPLKVKLQVSKNGIIESTVQRLENIKWTTPKDKTLIIEGDKDNQEIYNFGIKSFYDPFAINNQISVEVTYDGKTYRASTNFTFLKESGTNLIESHVETIKIEPEQKIVNNGIGQPKVTFKAYAYYNGIKNNEPLTGKWGLYGEGFEETDSNEYTISDFFTHGSNELFGEEAIVKIPKFLYGDQVVLFPSFRAQLKDLPKKPKPAPGHPFETMPDKQELLEELQKEGQYDPTIYDLSYTPWIYFNPLTNSYIYNDEFKWHLNFDSSVIILYKYSNGDAYRSNFKDAYQDMLNDLAYQNQDFYSIDIVLKQYENVGNEGSRFYRLQYYISIKDENSSFIDNWDGTLKIREDETAYFSRVSSVIGERSKDELNAFTGVAIGEVTTNQEQKEKDLFGFCNGKEICALQKGIVSAKIQNDGTILSSNGKKNDYLTFLESLEPVLYNSDHIGLKLGSNSDRNLFGGLIDCNNGQYYYNINEIIPLLLQEIKELKAQIKTLKG